MTYLQDKELKPEEFNRLCDVHKATVARKVSVVQAQVEQKKQQPGKPRRLSVEDQGLMSLEDGREDRTYCHSGQASGVPEATVCRIVKQVEPALIRCGRLQLPGKKQLLDPESAAKLGVIDAPETPIERPKKRQRRFSRGQKKRHPGNTQLVVAPKTKAVICPPFAAGKEDDFQLLKRSPVKFKQETKCLAAQGYQGSQKLLANTQLPKKRQDQQLSLIDGETNQSLERTRGICERSIGRLKVFKILAQR